MIMKIIMAARVTRRVTDMTGVAASDGNVSSALSGSMKSQSSSRLSLQKAMAANIRGYQPIRSYRVDCCGGVRVRTSARSCSSMALSEMGRQEHPHDACF